MSVPSQAIGLVEPGMVILPEHHNLKRDWLKAIFDRCRTQIPLTPEGQRFLEQWGKIRTVETGTMMLASDHNYTLDAIKRLYEYMFPWILDEPRAVELMSRYDELVLLARYVFFGDIVLANDHNILVQLLDILWELTNYLVGPRIMSSGAIVLAVAGSQIPMFVIYPEVVTS